MILNIDNNEQLELLSLLVDEEIGRLRDYIRRHKSDDPSELNNVRMDLNDLRILLGRLEDLNDMLDI